MSVAFNGNGVSPKVRLLTAIEDGTVSGADELLWLSVLESLQWMFSGTCKEEYTTPMFVTCDPQGSIRLCHSEEDWAIQMVLKVRDYSPMEPAYGTIRVGKVDFVTVVDESDIGFEYLFDNRGVVGDIVRMNDARANITHAFKDHLGRMEEYFISCIRDELIRKITEP